jgi:hypothetical protein
VNSNADGALRVPRAVLLVGLAGVLFLGLCYVVTRASGGLSFGDPVVAVAFVNETGEPVQFYSQFNTDRERARSSLVQPGERRQTRWMLAGDSVRITGTGPDGRLVFDRSFALKESRDLEVLVSSPSPLDQITGRGGSALEQ